MITFLVLAISVLTVLSGTLVWISWPTQLRLKRFAARPTLDWGQIYAQFFAGTSFPKQLVCELWLEVARTLRLPPGKLRPSDRFDKELAAVEGWEEGDESEQMPMVAERRMDGIGCNAAFAEIETLRDYVEFFCDPQKRQNLRGYKRRPRLKAIS